MRKILGDGEKILYLILAELLNRGESIPTCRELAELTGERSALSDDKNSGHTSYRFKSLQKKGFLEYKYTKRLNLELQLFYVPENFLGKFTLEELYFLAEVPGIQGVPDLDVIAESRAPSLQSVSNGSCSKTVLKSNSNSNDLDLEHYCIPYEFTLLDTSDPQPNNEFSQGYFCVTNKIRLDSIDVGNSEDQASSGCQNSKTHVIARNENKRQMISKESSFSNDIHNPAVARYSDSRFLLLRDHSLDSADVLKLDEQVAFTPF